MAIFLAGRTNSSLWHLTKTSRGYFRDIAYRVWSRQLLTSPRCLVSHQSRTFSSRSFREIKRFYNAADAEKTTDGFQITVDKRPVKTPLGNSLCVPSEALGMAVAAEWNAQEETVQLGTMHLTGLCNTVIDNPSKRTVAKQVEDILEYLHTDTVCFSVDDPPEMVELQEKEWTPLVQWFCKRYDVSVSVDNTLLSRVPDETLKTLSVHLQLMNRWNLTGLEYATESVKSLIIPLALVNRELTVEQAAYVSRLELEFQILHWGKVEWAHDVELMETRSRLAAAILFCSLTKDLDSPKDQS